MPKLLVHGHIDQTLHGQGIVELQEHILMKYAQIEIQPTMRPLSRSCRGLGPPGPNTKNFFTDRQTLYFLMGRCPPYPDVQCSCESNIFSLCPPVAVKGVTALSVPKKILLGHRPY